MSDTKNTENESGGLKKSLRLIYVYAIAAGAIFTFIGYWDTIFYEYCGAGTFLGFILMTLLILPRKKRWKLVKIHKYTELSGGRLCGGEVLVQFSLWLYRAARVLWRGSFRSFQSCG